MCQLVCVIAFMLPIRQFQDCGEGNHHFDYYSQYKHVFRLKIAHLDRERRFRPEWSLFPRCWSLFRTRPAFVPWLRLVWKDRSKDDLTKPRFCPKKHRPCTTLGPGSVAWFLSSDRPQSRAEGESKPSRAGADKKRMSPAVRRGESLYCPCRSRRSSVYEVVVVVVMWGSRRVISAFSCVNVEVRC